MEQFFLELKKIRRAGRPDEKKGEEKSAFEIVGGEKNQHPGIIYTPVPMLLLSTDVYV